MSFIIFTAHTKAANIIIEKRSHHTLVSLHDTSNKKMSREEKWTIYWKAFTTAINTKDKKSIAALTSKDFYDGGGGTVEQWLDGEVFVNEKQFNLYKTILKKGAKSFKNEGGGPYKATGKNDSGDLFFEYKNSQWLFGGVVGD
ncbi:MAG: hypothetical protein QM737_19785 [Ferruginibacter sp.]